MWTMRQEKENGIWIPRGRPETTAYQRRAHLDVGSLRGSLLLLMLLHITYFSLAGSQVQLFNFVDFCFLMLIFTILQFALHFKLF